MTGTDCEMPPAVVFCDHAPVKHASEFDVGVIGVHIRHRKPTIGSCGAYSQSFLLLLFIVRLCVTLAAFSFNRLNYRCQTHFQLLLSHPVPTDWSILLNLPDVSKATGLSWTTIYTMMGKSEFPIACKAGGSTVWYASEVWEWINTRPQIIPRAGRGRKRAA